MTDTSPEQQEPMIVVEIDGKRQEFELPDTEFTGHEWATLKRVADVAAGQLAEAQRNGDVLFIYALAIIAMRRAGKRVDEQEILGLGATSIKVHGAIEDEDGAENADPPDAGDVDAGSSDPQT